MVVGESIFFNKSNTFLKYAHINLYGDALKNILKWREVEDRGQVKLLL